jgi:hypothetical protein
VKQAENRVLENEDRVEELDQIVKDNEKMLRKYEWNMQDIWDTMNHRYRRRRGDAN